MIVNLVEFILIITKLMCNFQLSTLNMSRINYASTSSSALSSSYKTENLKKSNMKLPKVTLTTVKNHDAKGHKGYGKESKPIPLYREFTNYNYDADGIQLANGFTPNYYSYLNPNLNSKSYLIKSQNHINDHESQLKKVRKELNWVKWRMTLFVFYWIVWFIFLIGVIIIVAWTNRNKP